MVDTSKVGAWRTKPGSFLSKAQMNLVFSQQAAKHRQYDIEANRIYYALHQLAHELSFRRLLDCKRLGDRAEKRRKRNRKYWSMEHGSYLVDLDRLLGTSGRVERVYGRWKDFRTIADYEPMQVSDTDSWKSAVETRRTEAFDLAELIYEYIQRN